MEVEAEGGEGGEEAWERSDGGYCDGCWCVCKRCRSGGVSVRWEVEVWCVAVRAWWWRRSLMSQQSLNLDRLLCCSAAGDVQQQCRNSSTGSDLRQDGLCLIELQGRSDEYL